MIQAMKAQMAVAVTVLLVITTGHARADLAMYRFSGVLPADVTIDGDMFGKAAAGETWTVNVQVDLSIPDSVSDSTLGIYYDAALAADIVFSGGYSDSVTGPFSIPTFIEVYDNVNQRDGVLALLAESSSGLMVAVGNRDLATLTSDLLPVYLTSFSQDLNQIDVVLDYVSPGGGTVRYSSIDNGHFDVVPEPSTITLWSLAFVAVVIGRRRNRRRNQTP